MDLKRFTSAWVVVGAMVFVVKVSCAADAPYVVGQSSLAVVVSTASLTAPATAEVEPFVSPLGSLDAGIVSGFGKRDVVIPSTSTVAAPGPAQIKSEMHEGVDYGVPAGTTIYAARSGKVIFAGFSKMYVSRVDKKDQHRLVIIRHADGLSSRYVHLSGLHVRPGQDVRAGDVLGDVSESDEWSFPVFHFEIRNIQGKAIDPVKVMARVKKS